MVSGGRSEAAERAVSGRWKPLVRWLLGAKLEAKLGLGLGHAILPGASSKLASGLPARP